jgi:AraC-like DNA-binding protein
VRASSLIAAGARAAEPSPRLGGAVGAERRDRLPHRAAALAAGVAVAGAGRSGIAFDESAAQEAVTFRFGRVAGSSRTMTGSLVSKRMPTVVPDPAPPDLERSCTVGRRDWIRRAPGWSGVERIEAGFAGHAYDPHRHDTYAVGLTLAGVQTFDYRGERRDSAAGNVVVLHPDERHDGRAGIDGGFRYSMLYLDPRLIRDALGGSARRLPFVRAAVSADARLRRAAAAALADLDRAPEALEADQMVLALAEALLAQDRGAARGAAAGSCGRAVELARQYLDAHCGGAVGSAELERACGLDRFTLARQFRARLGTSPYRYLTMRRLDRARSLLGAGQPLAETAAACGFADQSHMSRQFKRTYGLSPGRWRAIHRAG